MHDDERTEDEADQPVSSIPAPPAPDAFTAVFGLIELVRNEAAYKRKLQGLSRALEAVTSGEKKLAADRAAFDQYETSVRAELDEREKAALAREVKAFTAEQALVNHELALAADRAEIDRLDRILKRRWAASAKMEWPTSGLQDPPSWQQILQELAGAAYDPLETEPEMEPVTDRVEGAPQYLGVRQTTFRKAPRSSSRRMQPEI